MGKSKRGEWWRLRRSFFIGAAVGLYGSATLAATLGGKVTDGSGTRALTGAQVEIVELGRRIEAGSDGSYRFVDVAPGTYTLRASYSGAATLEQKVVVSGDVPSRADLVIRAADGGTVELDTVLVVGQRANLSSSLSRQRAADEVQSVLTRDAIGQFPDQNVAEAVRRAPGITVLNDQGEGRFIAVRGLDPGLNAASINGVRVPAPEADVRAVALDVIPVELIESIEIKKSLTPDMDADTLGASIEISTTSAFDRRKSYTSLTAEGSYNDLGEDWSPKVAFDFSRLVGERLGVAGGLSYYDREFSTDNVEADGWSASDAGVVYAETIEYRDYDVTRTRTGGALSLDFLAAEHTTLYLRSLYSEFEDQEFRRRLIFEFDEAPASGDDDTARFSSDDGAITVARDIKDRYESQEILSLSTGGKSFVEAWTLDYQVSFAKAEEQERGSLDPVTFQQEFEGPGQFGVDFDYADRDLPRFAVDAGLDAFLDPSAYAFDSVERTSRSQSEDEEVAFKLDLSREFVRKSGVYQLKVGGKLRQREKIYDLRLDVVDGYDGDFSLADVAGTASYGLLELGPLPSRGVRGFFDANAAAFERNPVDSDFESAIADYAVDEDIHAAYLQGRFERGALSLVGGVRMERTENELAGNLVELVEEGGIRDEVVLDEDTVFVTPTQFDRRYTDWLPSLTLRYETERDWVLRAAAYASLLRPSVGQLAPRFLVEENDEGEREGEFGNPELDPLQAWNYDLGAEWYFGSNAVVQAGLFRKDIRDFIAVVVLEDFSFNGITASEASFPINGDEATVDGLEFNYQQAMSFLPAPFDGLLLGFNYTYTDAQGHVAGRSVPLPASARNTYNATVGYEKGPVSLRVATAYRDRYLDELGGDPQEDRFVEDHQQWDLVARYRLSSSLQLFGELINFTDEPYVAYQRGPGRDRLLQYEEYSFTAKLGVRTNF